MVIELLAISTTVRMNPANMSFVPVPPTYQGINGSIARLF